VIALVALAEGPRMLSNLVGVEPLPEALPLDLPLELCFERIDDEISLPRFRPAAGSGA
jgi:hypothetical protein